MKAAMLARAELSRLVTAMALLALTGGAVHAQSKQEDERRRLLEEIGLEKTAHPPPAPPPAAPAETYVPCPGPGEAAGSATGKTAPAPGRRTVAAPSFRKAIEPALNTGCGSCHRAGAPAGMTRLVLSGDALVDHGVVVKMVDLADPAASLLLRKASGATLHGGGAPWPEDGAAYARALAWIRAGARLDGEVPASPAAATGTATATATRPHVIAPNVAAAAAIPGPVQDAAVTPAPEVARDVDAAAAAPAPVNPPDAALHGLLMTACASCHRTGAMAGLTRLVLDGDATHDLAAARALIDLGAPERSPLVSKAGGLMHGGGAVLPAADPRAQQLLDWARSVAAAPPPAPLAAAQPASSTATTQAPAAAASSPPAGPPHAPSGAVRLPLDFALDGRFDLAYERRQFDGDPFAGGSVGALRSYHHFLFLSHDVGQPCGITAEVTSLLFWEAHCRLPRWFGPVQVTGAGGKIVVPFGADPLFHQSYGGLEGFDQVVLPVIWSIEGVAAHALWPLGELAVTDDLYVVRGYALAQPGAVLNLQNNFSPDDATRLGWGNRVGFAWRWLSAWYSSYFNTLGFGRRLFMQAVDVTVWRPRGIPVLQHFSAGAGLLRADVSGGGAGVGGVGYDYYDFASYFQLRYHPTEWLYLQYRQGLRTFDNRRGLILDNARLTSADGSTHSFGAVARAGALTFGIYYFINLEKVDEIRNDLLRTSLTYEF